MGNNIDHERIDEVLRGTSNLSGAINTAEYTAQFTIQPDTEWPSRGYDAQNIWYEQNGADISSLKPLATIAQLTTDGTQADSRVAVESPVVVYRPGTEVSASAGLFVDVLPTGDSKYQIQYGREERTIVDPYDGTEIAVGKEYAGFEIVEDSASDRSHDLEFVVGTDVDDDGTAEENRIPITNGDWESNEFITKFTSDPKAKAFGKDPLDGTGRSGIDFDATRGYLYGLEIGWYAPTALVPYIVETADVTGSHKQRKHPILIYNPIENPTIQRPNQPITVVADNASSGQDLQARLGGRFGGYRGSLRVQQIPTTHRVGNQDIPTAGGTTGTGGLNWFISAVVKPRAKDPDAVVVPNPAVYQPDNPAASMVRLADESDISGTIEYDEPSNTHRADTVFAIDAKEDTPDRLSLATDTFDGESKFVGQKVGGDILIGDKNEAQLSRGDKDFDFVLPREQVLVYMIAARSNSDVILDSVYDFNTVG